MRRAYDVLQMTQGAIVPRATYQKCLDMVLERIGYYTEAAIIMELSGCEALSNQCIVLKKLFLGMRDIAETWEVTDDVKH